MIITNLQNFVNQISKYKLKTLNFQNAFKALDKMFPERWEIKHYTFEDKEYLEKIPLTEYLKYSEENNNNCFYSEIIIYYPEVRITDGKLKHLITDLYVKLRITYQIELLGIRSSYTLSELRNNYCHSHLPNISIGFSNFCTGSGPINSFLWTSLDRSEEEWLYFFTLLNQFIEWESIAGRPYRRISNIGNYGEPQSAPIYVAEQILNKYKIKNIKYKISENSIDVIPSEAMEEEVVTLLTGTQYASYLCFKNSDGEYLSQVQVAPNKRYLEYKDKELFTFKGELIKIKILNERTDEQSNYIPNAPVPDLTKNLCAELSKRITKAYIKRSRVITEDTSKSTEEYSREDEILVL